MKHKTIRWIGVLFAILCIVSGGMLVAHAQESNASITYDYTDEQVDYDIEATEFPAIYNESGSGSFNFEFAGDSSTAIYFTNDGAKMWATADGEFTNSLQEFTLSNPYDVSTASYEDRHDFDDEFYDGPAAGAEIKTRGIQWSENGHYIHILKGGSESAILQYYTNDSFNLPEPDSIFDSSGLVFNTSIELGSNRYDGLEWVNDGSDLLTYSNTDTSLAVYSCSENYNVETCSEDRNIQNPVSSGEIRSIDTRNSESILMLGRADGSLLEFNMDSNYDISNSNVHTNDLESYNLVNYINDRNILLGTPAGVARVDWYDRLGNIESDRWLIDSNGNEIDGTRETAESLTGSIGYSPEMYSEISLEYITGTEPNTTSESESISIYGPGEMTIREEQTNDIVTEPVNVTAYGEESGIYSLDTSDGTVDITGLPDQAYTFSTDATGYTLRNKYIQELGNTESLYLLANDTERVTSQFLLEDTTNTFTSDARLVIERSIEGNGNQWGEIYSDSFGVEGVSVTLQEGVRYRISIENDEIRRTIGPYRAEISEQVTINPDSGDINVDSEGSWSMGANYDSDHINVRYTDPEDMTDSVSVTIHERGNESNVLVSDDTYTNPEDLRTEYQVPSQYNESNWIVSLEVDRAGETTVISMQVGPTLDTVPSDLDPMWRNVISVIIILTFGLAFSALNRAVGAIVLALVGGSLWWIGWLAGATAGVLVTAYLFIAIGYGIYTKTLR